MENVRTGVRLVMALSLIGSRVALGVGDGGVVGSSVGVSSIGTLAVGMGITSSGVAGGWLHPVSMIVNNSRGSFLEIIGPRIPDYLSGVFFRVGLCGKHPENARSLVVLSE